jgi:hypothetical protein
MSGLRRPQIIRNASGKPLSHTTQGFFAIKDFQFTAG